MSGVLQLSSEENKYDHRTLDEIEADLDERRKGHQFITDVGVELRANAQPHRPLPSSHWLVKQNKDRAKLEAVVEAIHKSYEDRLLAAAKWKALAKRKSRQLEMESSHTVRKHGPCCPAIGLCVCPKT